LKKAVTNLLKKRGSLHIFVRCQKRGFTLRGMAALAAGQLKVEGKGGGTNRKFKKIVKSNALEHRVREGLRKKSKGKKSSSREKKN